MNELRNLFSSGKKGPVTIEEILQMMEDANVSYEDLLHSMFDDNKMSGMNFRGLFSGGEWEDNNTVRLRHLRALHHVKDSKHNEILVNNPGVDAISAGFISNRDIKDLQCVQSVRHLNVGEVNIGVSISLTVVEDVFRMTGIQVLVQDSMNQMFNLAIYNLVSKNSTLRHCQNIIPKGSTIIVKEPYLKCCNNGTLGLRVDNVSNIIIIPPTTKSGTETGASRNAMYFKEKGNEYFGKADYETAERCYSVGIGVLPNSSNIELQIMLLSNRALVRLKRYDFIGALTDVQQALTIQPSHIKCLFREGEALLGLRRYNESEEKLRRLLEHKDLVSDISSKLLQIERLKRQSQTGEYTPEELMESFYKGDSNLRANASYVCHKTYHLEMEDYYGPIEVKYSKGKGRGIFLTTSVKRGTVIIVEKPFLSVQTNDIHKRRTSVDLTAFDLQSRRAYSATDEELLHQILETAKIYKPSLPRLSLLYDGSAFNNILPEMDVFRHDNHPFIINYDYSSLLSAARIRGIIQKNAFSFKSDTRLFFVTSLINHSSDPNACVSTHLTNNSGGAVLIKTLVDLEQGSEITIKYRDDIHF